MNEKIYRNLWNDLKDAIRCTVEYCEKCEKNENALRELEKIFELKDEELGIAIKAYKTILESMGSREREAIIKETFKFFGCNEK